ncbi:MAG: hypothetical protein RIQ81_1491 [Pseudomonadota bacterium]
MGLLKKSSRLIGRFVLSNLVSMAALGGEAALAQSASFNHNYVNTMRSGTVSHMFVSQSVDGEFGKFSATTKPGTSADALASVGGALGPSSDSWRGFGIGTSFGLEVLKFVQFTSGHTFVSLRRNDDGLQTLSGSRLHAGAKFVFTAPLANLELGGGVLGSRMDLVQRLQRGDYYGSGLFYSLGMNYFLSSQVSVFGTLKTLQERLVQTGGDSTYDTIRNNSTTVGTGFSIWL